MAVVLQSVRKSEVPISDLDVHRDALLRCRRCSLGDGIRPIVSGAKSPRAMLVGQAPGKVEAEGGVPFSGRAGRTLFRWLARAGLDESSARDLIYISAITRCFPGAHPSGRGDRVPTREEQARCADWLDTELRIIRPAVIIPVGRLAIERFLPKLPLSELVGTRHSVDYGVGRAVAIPLPHPSGASSWIHQAGNGALVEKALQLIGSELRTSRN
jgi:uracil-DNA glycosylase